MSAISTDALGKRYGSTWALRDCTLEIPAGSVTALVGPNGAGKTTLLKLAVGLTRPSAGGVEVLGLTPREDERELMPKVGFVAQDHPLHMGFTIADTLKLGRRLNPSWNDDIARERIEHLRLPLDRKVGKLSVVSPDVTEYHSLTSLPFSSISTTAIFNAKRFSITIACTPF